MNGCGESAIDAEGASYCVERSLAVLPPSISALFFIWFVLIFVHLAKLFLEKRMMPWLVIDLLRLIYQYLILCTIRQMLLSKGIDLIDNIELIL